MRNKKRMNNYDEYIDIVNDVLDLHDNSESSVQIIENSKDFYLQNRELFKNIVPDYCEGKISCGIFASYGFRLYAATIGNKIELLTHQDGYTDSPIFSYQVDDIIDYSKEHDSHAENENNIEEYNEESREKDFLKVSSVLLEWSINPQSNIDILPEVLSKMIIPAIKRIRKSIIDKRPVINILLPPFSKDFTSSENYEGEESDSCFDFNTILNSSDFEDIEINIQDYSSLINLKGAERKYLGIHHTDGINDYLIFSVFENIRGHKECIGCVAINLNSKKEYILQPYKQQLIFDKQVSAFLDTKTGEDIIYFSPVENKFPIPTTCSSYLGTHTTSFIDNEYILKNNELTGNKEIDKIISLFSGMKSMSVAEICARYLEEPNLYNIALGDMVYIAILLEQHGEIFQSSLLKLKRKDRIFPVQNTEFKHYKSEMLAHLPSNFAKIGWKINYVRKLKIIPFRKIGYKLYLKQITESIVNHFDDCTTDDVIEEYMFIHTKNKQTAIHNVPSAMSAAKMFIEMINIDSIAINYCKDLMF